MLAHVMTEITLISLREME